MGNVTTIAMIAMAFTFSQLIHQGQTVVDGSSSQNPVFGNERSRIEFLAGNFATATMIPASPSLPKGATGKGTSVVAWALDSMYLSIEEQSMNSLLGHYKGHGMLGFDSQTHEFVLSMFNNLGDHPTYHGNFVGDTLILETKVPSPRGTFDQKLLWYKDGRLVKLKVLNDMGKGPALVLEQTATPVSQKLK
jgi:hypothetical protein